MTDQAELENILGQLSLEEKISLLAGADGWQTQEIPRLGIGSLKTTDGPAGARGALSVDGPPAAFLPAPVSQAATWSKEHLFAIGQLLCREAKTKAAQVLLAPTICCARNPLGGRNFESFSEDPRLSGELAIEYVRGVQETGEVAATVKHFVANEQEYQRFTINAQVSERALREIYLRPFETVIKSKNPPKCVMTSYNCVNGAHMDTSPILKDILRGEWRFEGLVMSDWGGTNTTVESLIAGCDLEMPGPSERRGKFLLKAAQENPSHELLAAIDASGMRVLSLLGDLKLLGLSPETAANTRHSIETSSSSKADQKLLRDVAADGIVLLKNEDSLLPLSAKELQGKKIAFIGPNAFNGTPGGGGSATMVPLYQTQPFAAFQSALIESNVSAEIRHSPGTFIHKWLPLTTSQFVADDEKSMLRLDFLVTDDFSSSVIETQYRDSSCADFFDSAPLSWYKDKKPHSVIITSQLKPATTGTHSFGISSVGNARLFVDGHLLIDNFNWKDVGEAFYAFGSVETRADIEMTAGETYEIRIEACTKVVPDGTANDDPVHVFGLQPSVRLGYLEQLPVDPVGDAVKLSNESDLTIVIIGLNDEWESEGYDRKTMQLPSEQDELIYRLLRESKNLERIVIVNQSGSPVEMPWANKVGTIVQAWYGGQEAGNALSDVLLGRVNPSGRLPISWPMEYKDLDFKPDTWPGVDGVVKYTEDIYVGYRWYQHMQIEPRWWLGHGCSYTVFEHRDFSVTLDNEKEGWNVSVEVQNVGSVEGRDVVQCYISRPAAIRELKAFEKTSSLKPKETQVVDMAISYREIAHWDTGRKTWVLEPGNYEFALAKHAGDKAAVNKHSVLVAERMTWLL